MFVTKRGGFKMKTLQRSALEAMSKKQLMEVLITFRNRGSYWQYNNYITEQLSHGEMKKVANALPALDEMAQHVHRTQHKRVFRGKLFVLKL